MDEIASRYNHKETEDKWYKFWQDNNKFAAKPNPSNKPFCIVIPPPNVTGILHMGHALNITIQDILIRYHRMKGEDALWMPGTDHAGIATQNVVEKALYREGLRRQDLGREKFIERVWQWKEQYGSIIIRQLKKLGASCDWSRVRFTMDEEYSKAVVEVFVRLYEKGLIYRGSYIINWCPRCQTALSDEEAPHRELQGNLYYLRYLLKEELSLRGGAKRRRSNPKEIASPLASLGARNDAPYIVVATTRPETMLGDTAVAVNPKDKRYKHLIGKTLILPLVNREIKIIADAMVDMKFGTGAVKVTPAHDPNDYALGKKHKLEFINVMHPDGRMNENAGEYDGMDRFEAREVILEDLKEKGFLQKVEAHPLSAGHCYRCHTIIEPYLSKQWFVKMKPLSKPALEAVNKGKIKFHPKRWTKVYVNWMENIQDWCISRQIWWGHRLPVYYCKNCQENHSHCEPKAKQSQKLDCFVADAHRNDGSVIVSRIKPEKCPNCGLVDIYQDEDVLDTWFSSWLWPFATFGWPFLGSRLKAQDSRQDNIQPIQPPAFSLQQSDLDYFYPTSVLVTAPEIIFFWVARMIMAGLEFMKDIPFRDVYIHGTVRDTEGKKMSKSLGNIIDPLEIIDEYGTDALRFSLISITAQGQDVFLSKERFEQGRNFANKIWNASRFILMNLDPGTKPSSHLVGGKIPTYEVGNKVELCVFFKKENLSLANRWILSRFYSLLKEINKDLDAYKFNEAANALYGFFWHEFCDWYLELAKPILVNRAQNTEYTDTQIVMYKVLEKSLRILHPFMPFITEEVWQKLPHQGKTIMEEPWPHIQEQIIDKKLEKQAHCIFDVITQIRNLRSSMEIAPEQKVGVSIFSHSKLRLVLLKDNLSLIKDLAKLESLEFLNSADRPASTISAVVENFDIYLHFGAFLDIAKERQKFSQRIDGLTRIKAQKEERLKNEEFLKRAPKEIVEKEREGLAKVNDELKRMEKMFNELR